MLGAVTPNPAPLQRRRRRWVVWGVLLLGLSALGTWSLLRRVAVYAVASPPHVTGDPALQFLIAPVAGLVSATYLQVGREVQAAEVLVELDGTEQRLQVEEEGQRLLALEAQRAARQQEGTALAAASHAATQEARAALEEAQARYREATSALQGAQEKTQRLGPFAPLTALSPQQAALDSSRQTLQRLEREQQVRAAEWGSRLAQFQREVVSLNGDVALATARLARLEHALRLRHLRAPVTGRLGAVAHLQTGAFVQAGERLGVIAPAEALLVTATVAPVLPSRPVQAGQSAWLQSPAVPGVASRSLAARVVQAAAVEQDERQRVVLRLVPEALPHWPLQPGVLWTATVEVERIPRLTLLLRVLRQCLAGQTHAASSQRGPAP